MEVEIIYNAAPCNVTPGCFVVAGDRYILYASGRTIVACEIHADSIENCVSRNVATFYHHDGIVNHLSWVEDTAENESILLSCSNDKTACLWSFAVSDLGCSLSPICKLVGHNDSVMFGSARKLQNQVIVCTASLDSTVKVWLARVTDCSWECMQTIGFNGGFALCLTMTLLQAQRTERETRHAMLAVSFDDNSVRLYTAPLCEMLESKTQTTTDAPFRLAYSLKSQEEWVRALEFLHLDSLYLVSGGQDASIRIWKLTELEPTSEHLVLRSRSTLKVDSELAYSVQLDSLLTAHADHVYACHFMRGGPGLRLISCSLDKSILLWQREAVGWFEVVRLGRVGGGDNVLGYVEARAVALLSGEELILACDYNGAFHCWKREAAAGSAGWMHLPIVTAHNRAVNDLGWSPAGDLLFTVSDDQTTRVHAAIADPHCRSRSVWLEIGRPQVHGYNLRCIALLDSHVFVSGSLDEKVLRAFCATRQFISDYERLAQRQLRFASTDCTQDALFSTLPLAANVPALGLTNKAMFNQDSTAGNEHDSTLQCAGEDEDAAPVCLTETIPQPHWKLIEGETRRIRVEDDLVDGTLWPEFTKLYGHPNDATALDACRFGGPNQYLVASACSAKVSRSDDAQIILWHVRDRYAERSFDDRFQYTLARRLAFHKSTVLQLRFSNAAAGYLPTGSPLRLLSVSLDRSFAIFQCTIDAQNECNYQRVASSVDPGVTQVHSRVIWGCAWSPDDAHFATISRDRVLAIWTSPDSESKLQLALLMRDRDLPDCPTSVDFAPRIPTQSHGYLIAIGYENGLVQLLGWSPSQTIASTLWSSATNQLHCATVNRVRFRPTWPQEQDEDIVLATCSSDATVKCLRIRGFSSVS